MKSAVVYSSLTGNTKMIGEAIFEALPGEKEIFAVENAPADTSAYDVVFVGYWVDKGTADSKAKAYLESLKNQKVALFATLGAYPDSDHARESLEKGGALLPEGNEVVGGFICQGKVDPKLVEAMAKMFPIDHPHGMNPERIKRLEDASKHPNEDDCKNAAAFAKEVAAKIGA